MFGNPDLEPGISVGANRQCAFLGVAVLEKCFDLLTGQSVPILMCLERCAFRCRSCPIFTRTTLCLCNWSFTLSFATSARNGFQLSRGG